jgi:hypothetical protein
MIRKALVVFGFFVSLHVYGWGVTGHRVVGHVAEIYLSKKAKKELSRVLGHQSLAYVSNWMDDIKSDRAYDHTQDWHWVTIPDGRTYEESEKNPNGDIIETIERLISELKKGGLEAKKEAEHVKMLVHLVGDIHQPLHVGRGDDKGGNDVRVRWFSQNSNLHRVWDTDMIDGKKWSYTEIAKDINHTTPAQVKALQAASVRDWAYESMALRSQVYDVPENGNLGYEYSYKHYRLVERRLLEAGVRLAGLLNEIYR